jgi:hypothetical protein
MRLLTFFTLLFSLRAWSGPIYVSAIDKELAFNRVLFYQPNDNVSGIFSTPLGNSLKERIESEKLWDLILAPTPSTSPDGIDILLEDPVKVANLIQKNSADALLKLTVIKGPNGIQLRLGLFTASGKVLSLKDVYKIDKFEISYLTKELYQLYDQLVKDIPFQALVLSRIDTNVTINRGNNAGLLPNSELNIVQVVSVERHPKFNFIVNSQKEILGKIRLTKVDDNLSFATILYEKEPLVVQPSLKVIFNNPKIYPNLVNSENRDVISDLANRPDSSLMLGAQANEWQPAHMPTFGKVDIALGLGSYQTGSNLSINGGAVGNTIMALDMNLNLELWVNPNWLLGVTFDQGAASLANPIENSEPSKLNFSLSKYNLMAGYNLLLEQNYFGPKLQLLAGITSFQSQTDDSTPTAFTSMTYSGFGFGLRAIYPFEDHSPWTIGGETFVSFMPQSTETPVTSGDVDSTTIVSFAGFGSYRIKANTSLLGNLLVDNYATTFTGSGTRKESATDTTHSWVRLAFGLEFLY